LNGDMSQSQQYENQRRSRHPDELHLSGATNMASQRGGLSPRDYTQAGPRISLEQAGSEPSQYPSAGLPGSLQPGRPGPITANTAPNVPTIPQTMAQEQYSSPSRSSALGLSHKRPASMVKGTLLSHQQHQEELTRDTSLLLQHKNTLPKAHSGQFQIHRLGWQIFDPAPTLVSQMDCQGQIHTHTTALTQSPPTATILHHGLYMRSIGVSGRHRIMMQERWLLEAI